MRTVGNYLYLVTDGDFSSNIESFIYFVMKMKKLKKSCKHFWLFVFFCFLYWELEIINKSKKRRLIETRNNLAQKVTGQWQNRRKSKCQHELANDILLLQLRVASLNERLFRLFHREKNYSPFSILIKITIIEFYFFTLIRKQTLCFLFFVVLLIVVLYFCCFLFFLCFKVFWFLFVFIQKCI